MKVYYLEQKQVLPIGLKEAWAFFSSPRNLDEITPDDLGFRIESLRSETMHEGQIITYRVMVFPGVWVSWVTEIKAVDEGRAFIDEQRFGPYAFWHHRHVFEERDHGICVLDQVHYGMPFGVFGRLVHRLFVRRKLERIFDYRKAILAEYFGTARQEASAALATRSKAVSPR